MGLNYSLGITFNNEKDANFCCSEFQNQKITKLSLISINFSTIIRVKDEIKEKKDL